MTEMTATYDGERLRVLHRKDQQTQASEEITLISYQVGEHYKHLVEIGMTPLHAAQLAGHLQGELVAEWKRERS